MRTIQNKLILVIDDSDDNCTLLETLLRANGWDVYTASDGAEALMILAECSKLPDLILLDLEMPGMNGETFRIEQSRNERIKHIPVVIMSGSSDQSEMLGFSSRGRLTKPFKLNTVVSCVNSYLQGVDAGPRPSPS